MAGEEKKAGAFSALSFQEQQEKWLSWRSQHLAFEPADMEPPKPQVAANEPVSKPLPQPITYAPPRHGALDRLYQRHASAKRQTGAFTSIT